MLKASFALAAQSKTNIWFSAGKKTGELKSTILSLGTGNISEEKKLAHRRSATYWSQQKNWTHPYNSEAKTVNPQWNTWKTTQQTVLLPPSEVSSSARAGHCSGALSGKRCLSAIICPDSLCVLRLLPISVAVPVSCPCCSFFNCGISSQLCILHFCLVTTQSEAEVTTTEAKTVQVVAGSPGGLLLSPSGRKALPLSRVFQSLTELRTQAERRGCTTLPPATSPGATTAAGLGHPWQQGWNFFPPPQFSSIYFLNLIVCYSQLYSSDSTPTFIKVQRLSWTDEFAEEQLTFKGEEYTPNLPAWKTNWILPMPSTHRFYRYILLGATLPSIAISKSRY